jgi:hypothetical protein
MNRKCKNKSAHVSNDQNYSSRSTSSHTTPLRIAAMLIQHLIIAGLIEFVGRNDAIKDEWYQQPTTRRPMHSGHLHNNCERWRR